MVLDESLIRDNLYNWLGFGNPNGTYWFIGREESIALSKCGALSTWDDYFEARRSFDIAMDFRNVWVDTFERPLSTFTNTTTWHYQAAFLLAFHDQPVTSSAVKRMLFDDPQFCRTMSDHFSGEFFPLPKKSKNTIAPYDHIWDDETEYQHEVMPGRTDLLLDTLRENPDVDWLITYSPHCARALREACRTSSADSWRAANGEYQLFDLHVDGRTIGLLETPFLGYGHVGYEGIEALVDKILDRY
jgi:hypothetical protein